MCSFLAYQLRLHKTAKRKLGAQGVQLEHPCSSQTLVLSYNTIQFCAQHFDLNSYCKKILLLTQQTFPHATPELIFFLKSTLFPEDNNHLQDSTSNAVFQQRISTTFMWLLFLQVQNELKENIPKNYYSQRLPVLIHVLLDQG